MIEYEIRNDYITYFISLNIICWHKSPLTRPVVGHQQSKRLNNWMVELKIVIYSNAWRGEPHANGNWVRAHARQLVQCVSLFVCMCMYASAKQMVSIKKLNVSLSIERRPARTHTLALPLALVLFADSDKSSDCLMDESVNRYPCKF